MPLIKSSFSLKSCFVNVGRKKNFFVPVDVAEKFFRLVIHDHGPFCSFVRSSSTQATLEIGTGEVYEQFMLLKLSNLVEEFNFPDFSKDTEFDLTPFVHLDRILLRLTTASKYENGMYIEDCSVDMQLFLFSNEKTLTPFANTPFQISSSGTTKTVSVSKQLIYECFKMLPLLSGNLMDRRSGLIADLLNIDSFKSVVSLALGSDKANALSSRPNSSITISKATAIAVSVPNHQYVDFEFGDGTKTESIEIPFNESPKFETVKDVALNPAHRIIAQKYYDKIKSLSYLPSINITRFVDVDDYCITTFQLPFKGDPLNPMSSYNSIASQLFIREDNDNDVLLDAVDDLVLSNDMIVSSVANQNDELEKVGDSLIAEIDAYKGRLLDRVETLYSESQAVLKDELVNKIDEQKQIINVLSGKSELAEVDETTVDNSGKKMLIASALFAVVKGVL